MCVTLSLTDSVSLLSCAVSCCRRDFLSAGTMAKGAAESGVAESYMCAKVARNPWVQQSCAAYLGEFEAQEGANNINKGTQWLVRLTVRPTHQKFADVL